MEVLLKPKLWDRVRFVELQGPTRGAAETVLLGLEGLSQDLQERPILLCDGDTFYTADIVNQYRQVAKNGRNAVFCFKDDQEKVFAVLDFFKCKITTHELPFYCFVYSMMYIYIAHLLLYQSGR